MKNVLIEISTIYGYKTAECIIEMSNLDVEGNKLIFLISDNTKYPEAENKLLRNVSKLIIKRKYKNYEIKYLNEILSPYHPSSVSYKDINYISKTIFRNSICLDEIDLLLLESIQVSPALLIANIFEFAEIYVYADGLMVYSPTRFDLGKSVISRISRLYYVDLIKDIQPLLLKEANVALIKIDKSRLIKAFDLSYIDTARLTEKHYNIDKKVILILGQYLSSLDLITVDEEINIYSSIIKQEYQKFGKFYTYVFKPHPSSSYNPKLILNNITNDIDIIIDNCYFPVEFFYNKSNTYRVVGVFSTALFSLNYLYGIVSQSYYCDLLYKKLPSWFNSNRIPILLSNFLLSKNYKDISSNDIACINILHAVSYDLVRFYNLYKNELIASLIKSSSFKRELQIIAQEPITKIVSSSQFKKDFDYKTIANYQREKKDKNLVTIYTKDEICKKSLADILSITKCNVNMLRTYAEYFIDNNDYHMAKRLLLIASTIKPNNRKLKRRIVYLQFPNFLKKILKNFSNPFNLPDK